MNAGVCRKNRPKHRYPNAGLPFVGVLENISVHFVLNLVAYSSIEWGLGDMVRRALVVLVDICGSSQKLGGLRELVLLSGVLFVHTVLLVIGPGLRKNYKPGLTCNFSPVIDTGTSRARGCSLRSSRSSVGRSERSETLSFS